MSPNLKPYSEYKESGSKWLASVPSHWGVHNLRTLIRRRNERNRPDLPLLSVAREKGVFVRSLTDDKENHNVIPEDLSNYKVARTGNLVINKMKAWQGSMGIAPCDGIVSPAYFIYDFNISNRSFGQTLLRSKPYVAHFAQASDGVRIGQWDLTIAGMRQIPVLVPPEEEQAAIVRFLNWANNRLGRAIKAKQKQIELLNEQKQAIIHGGVTRGLDPSVPLKPSGMPWLGEIPTHWDVRKLRTCAELIVSNVDKHSHVNEKPVRLCNYTDVYKNEHITSTLNFMHATATDEEILKFRIRVGDVVITKDSEEWDDIGVPSFVAYEDDDLVCGYHLAILRPRRDLVLGDFLFRTLQDRFVATQMHISAKGVTRYGLSHQGIKDIIIPLPPKNEQMSICTTLSRDLERFDIIRARLEREIDLLQEYRTRLIADVVTGKLDVREAAAKLPEEEIEEIAEVNEDLESDDEEIAV